jgi:hypothetical protein
MNCTKKPTTNAPRHAGADHPQVAREAERMLGESKTILQAAKELQISEQTYHRWRNQDGVHRAGLALAEPVRRVLPVPRA